MADLRLCCNCAHYLRQATTILDRCGRVAMDLNVQYVRPEPPEYSYCTTQRSRSGGSCGPEGRLYEEAPLELKLTQDWRPTVEMEALMATALAEDSAGVDDGAA